MRTGSAPWFTIVLRGMPIWPMAVLAALLTGCVSSSGYIGQHALPATRMLDDPVGEVVAGELAYQLQPGDVLDVKFFYNADLNETLIIAPDGRVALQLVGEMVAAGLSTQELKNLLTERYKKIVRQPELAVILRKYAASKVFVGGEVNSPGAQALDGGNLSAFQAIIQSGGFRRGAERHNVVVLRHSGTGKLTFIKLNMQAHLEQRGVEDIPLKPFDIVFVPQRRIAEVAEFFEEYLSKIVPLYRNIGFSFTYDLKREVQVRTQ